MLEFSKIPEDVYDESATQITYCKLFPLILEDFISRKDAEQMMLPSNLPVNTTVNTVLAGAAPPPAFAITGTGIGKGTGVVNPPFNGSSPHPTNEITKTQKKLIKDSGGRTTQAILDKALGG